MPRGLRRSEPSPSKFDWRSGLPVGSSNAAVVPPDQGSTDLVSGEATSSAAPAFGAGTTIAGNYKDQASQPKPSKAPAHPGGPPFNLTR